MEWLLHPTDNDAGTDTAFRHALRIAVAGRLGIWLIYVAPDLADPRSWKEFPAIRQRIESWGLLPPGSRRGDVPRMLGVEVYKETLEDAEPAEAIAAAVDEFHPALVVLGTERRRGVPRWLHPSVAERTAQRTDTPTLFVPDGVPGFVASDGAVSLQRILLPIDYAPDHAPAARMAVNLSEWLGATNVTVSTLHVTANPDADGAPVVRLPAGTPLQLDPLPIHGGAAAESIIQTATALDADLIVMATAGHQGILDALRGSTSEQVLREAPCPVLAVPA